MPLGHLSSSTTMSTRWSRVVVMWFSTLGSKGRVQIITVFFSSVVLSWSSMKAHRSFLLPRTSEERGNRDWNRGSHRPADLAWNTDLPIYASKMFDKNLNRLFSLLISVLSTDEHVHGFNMGSMGS
ncbi:uncharacterized protein [Lolium perenne]|uniref:uncharacterized protein isoform X2 n=1 Tax=Lolium perenne TaxID=4522 RepID=UPI003A99F621